MEQGIDKLITTQLAKCGTSGFLTGSGGLITLPVAVPANISSVLFIQMRMIASIAIMRGYDVKDDQVRTFVYASLTGKAATDILK
nr:EcsC family protein [Exiguobacterium sp. s140]